VISRITIRTLPTDARAWLDGVVDDATLAAALASMADVIAHL
jgi:hypothetical protein